MTIKMLTNINILVTRPVHQADAFCELLEQQGGRPIRMPVIEIEAVSLSQEVKLAVEHIDEITFAVFISPNAVEYGLTTLLAHGKIPDKLKLVTIGQASVQKMQDLLGRTPDIYPIEQYNSETLLALDGLQRDQVNHQRVLIFRGQGGRELLASTLRQRGARVEYAEVYQRKKPDIECSVLESVWASDNSPDILTVTSDEGLKNLVAMHDCSCDEQVKFYLNKLHNTPLVVVTEKMRISAQKLGFKSAIIIAAKTSNEALLESVLDWAKIRKQKNKLFF